MIFELKRFVKVARHNLNYGFLSLQAIIQTILFSKYYKKHKEIKGNIDPLLKDKICIFSHFDINNLVADYVVYYLKALNESGCAIWFISTSKKLDNASIEKIKPFCASICIRTNRGMDFGSFCLGLEKIKHYNHHDLLIFANDSVYGPLHSLEPIFKLISQQQADVVGITDSWQVCYHLQSYFLAFTKKVYSSHAFEKFFKKFKFSNDKNFIIHEYEVGLSRMLVKNGFKLKALCNYLQMAGGYIKTSKNHKIHQLYNPSHTFWKALIEEFHSPFLKRELIIYNPSQVPDVYTWPEIVKNTSYDVNLIENHLKQLSVKRKKW